jgi:hypothetical protein
MNTELSIEELDCVSGGDNVIAGIMKTAWTVAEAVGKAVSTAANAIPEGSGAGSGSAATWPKSTWL